MWLWLDVAGCDQLCQSPKVAARITEGCQESAGGMPDGGQREGRGDDMAGRGGRARGAADLLGSQRLAYGSPRYPRSVCQSILWSCVWRRHATLAPHTTSAPQRKFLGNFSICETNLSFTTRTLTDHRETPTPTRASTTWASTGTRRQAAALVTYVSWRRQCDIGGRPAGESPSEPGPTRPSSRCECTSGLHTGLRRGDAAACRVCVVLAF